MLKRAQKGSEGESTEGGLSAVNDMSSEILYLLDPAQGVCMLEGNISRRDIHKLHWNVEMHVGCEHFWASLRRSSGALGLGVIANLGLKPKAIVTRLLRSQSQ